MEESKKTRGDRLTKLLVILAGGLVLAIIALGAFFVGRESKSEARPISSAASGDFDYSLLNQIRQVLGKDYVKQENLDDQALFEAAINGMLGLLNDKGTYYMTPEDFQTDTTLTGSFEGIGATVSAQNNEIVIVSPIKDTAAEKAGLKSGDVILAVDGESTKGWTVEKTVLRIRGPRGTQVTISIRHADGKTEDYKLTRQTVQVESVSTLPPGGSLKDASGNAVSGIAYVHIREFSRRTPQELEQAVKEQISQGAKSLIIDVRSNPGGLLNTTIQSADEFLDNGNIVIQRDGSGRETAYTARNGQIIPANMPIVLLQNRYSASASEVLAAALQDNGRATIIGEKSFGKGTVNTARELDNGGAVYVSIANWLTPKGALIDNVGVVPDIEVKRTDEDIDLRRDPEVAKAIEVLRGMAKAP
ncbi:MAG TPA: S41 family peptidase [Dehalococcoidia bacterium]|nr:S41 family peptidase [Dehalococcoidia bacterium]